jgi:lipopolysaccharide transport system ATP-binding protein
MNNDIAISVKDLSKAYTIAHGALKKPTFRDVVMERVRHPFRRPQLETFWALKDVSFDVKKGEVVGIIGRNGAGKSTLLKILSRITEPTTGRIELYGRVGSLLEVGTGFHPELTGRENVFLNGAILGMSRAEIRKQFDAIVDFAEVEQFIDTPVKRYSSGMYVRLAFAVAAHLTPEILIVDEVLAVGDAEFQKKCLGKMDEVAKGGRTVLFVSHNMGAVQSLCSRGVLLEGGRATGIQQAQQAVASYLAGLMNQAALLVPADRERAGQVDIIEVRLRDKLGSTCLALLAGDDVVFELEYSNPLDIVQATVTATVYNQLGVPVTCLDGRLTGFSARTLGSHGRLVCTIPHLPLPPGRYRLAVCVVFTGTNERSIRREMIFEVVGSAFYKNGQLPNPSYCTCMIEHHWEHQAQ